MKKLFQILVLFLIPALQAWAVWFPEKPFPPRLVNDLTGLLNAEQLTALEDKLTDFSLRTTTQIVIVTVPSLHGEDISFVSTEIGQQWGVGQKEKDNGVVILIKPKTPDEKGEVDIAIGYGLEPVIPDAIAKRIIENEILPRFKQNDYYGGIDSAINVIMQLSLGEFSAKEYEARTKSDAIPGGIFTLIVLAFIFLGITGRARNVSRHSIGRNLPLWILLSLLGSGSGSSSRHSRSSWGNFSSGGGSFRGGGFGGFGGGGFGGGGASGSW